MLRVAASKTQSAMQFLYPRVLKISIFCFLHIYICPTYVKPLKTVTNSIIKQYFLSPGILRLEWQSQINCFNLWNAFSNGFVFF